MAPGVTSYHAVDHSLGGALLFSLVAADGENILSVTMVNPGSRLASVAARTRWSRPPTLTSPVRGGGTINPDFARLMGEGDHSSNHPTSPRVIMNIFVPHLEVAQLGIEDVPPGLDCKH